MKKKIILGLLIALFPATAQADENGGWVKVDASGVVISQGIVCTQAVCGDPGNDFGKATLQAGQRWVQQTLADPVTGNVAAYGNNNGTKVSVDNTGTWTIESEKTVTPVTITPLPINATIKEVTRTQFKTENTSGGNLNNYYAGTDYSVIVKPVEVPKEAIPTIQTKMAKPDFYYDFFGIFGNWFDWWSWDWNTWNWETFDWTFGGNK